MRAPVTVRPLAPLDSAAAQALAEAVFGDAPYASSMLAALDGALRAESEEYRALVVRENSALIGLIVFGATAGALGAGRIYFVAVDGSARRRGIATALIGAACEELRSRGARFVAVEMPEEPRLDGGRAVALRAGFRPESRVGDYVRDGVGLAFLRRDLRDAHDAAR
jgi:ribosomal protein S18 acetylase RimI-like enzyme